MSFHQPMRARLVTAHPPPLAEKITEDPITSKTAQSTVSCAYQTNLGGYWRNVTVLWCKNLMNHSLSLMVNSPEGECFYNCKIDVKPWHFWSKRGYKCFEVEGNQVDVYWDLQAAKFGGSPEPCSDYYVALVSDEEVVLLLGDLKKKAYKRTKARPALVDAIQYYKKENVFAKKSFSTRAKFDERKKEHDIVVESSTTGPKDPEMWISIDGIVVIHVQNLKQKVTRREVAKAALKVTPAPGAGITLLGAIQQLQITAFSCMHGKSSDKNHVGVSKSLRWQEIKQAF